MWCPGKLIWTLGISSPIPPKLMPMPYRGVYVAGYQYLQFDDTVWAYLCSGKEQRIIRDRGDDPAALMGVYKQIIQHALKAKPADMTITTHVRRGNFRST